MLSFFFPICVGKYLIHGQTFLPFDVMGDQTTQQINKKRRKYFTGVTNGDPRKMCMVSFQYILFLLSLHIFICQKFNSIKHARIFSEISPQQAFKVFFKAPTAEWLEEQEEQLFQPCLVAICPDSQ